MDQRNDKNSTARRPRRQKSGRAQTGCLILMGIVLLFGAISIGAFFVMANRKPAKPLPEGIRITVGDQEVWDKYHPALYEGTLAYPVAFVKEYIDPTIFWDEKTEQLTITTSDKVIRMATDELTYYVNQEPFSLELPVYQEEGAVYIPQDILQELYQFQAEYREADMAVILDFDSVDKKTAVMGSWRQKIYEEPDKKSAVVCKTNKEEPLVVFGESGEFTKVRTEAGFVGYILTKKLPEERQTTPGVVKTEEPKELWTPENGKINMVWDQVFKLSQSASAERRTEVLGLDVISPTWFKIADTEGNLANIADLSYVQWAHQNGYQVWALVSNNLEAENIGELTHETLSDTNKREKMIKQILAFASLYDLDGINIDFESVPQADAEYYVQFLRELAPYLKEAGLVLSVDMHVPSPWYRYYNMEAVGEIADYICVMVYDEHYGGSAVAGSTSSLGWAEDSIVSTLELVPKEKVIMAVPFYTRLWSETPTEDGVKLGTAAKGMEAAQNVLTENQVEPTYDAETGQNYVEFEKDGVTYKMWMEDALSMQKRMDLIQKYDLAGSAAWKKVFETEVVWEVIRKSLKN